MTGRSRFKSFGLLAVLWFAQFGFSFVEGAAVAQAPVSFFTPPTYAGSGTMFGADFNGDGKPDILSGDGTLQLGKGNGSFTTGTAVKGGPLAVADFNGDGKPDVLEQGTGTLLVLLGKGDGTFQAPISTNSGANLAGLAAADLNGDGKADVVGVFNSSLVVYLSKGDGTFAAGVSYNLGLTPSGLLLSVFGDFTGDNKTDVGVIAGDPNAGYIVVLPGNGDGTFQSAKISTGVSYPGSAVEGDFNGDGKLDLAIAAQFPNGNAVSLLVGNGDGTFQAPTEITSGSGGLAAVDVNGDGKLDLVFDAPPFLEIWLGDGKGGFSISRSYANQLNNPSYADVGSLAVLDFNGDGKLDIAAGNYILLGDGDGTFQGQPASLNVNPYAVGDFDKNGTEDVAGIDSIFLNDGTGTLTLKQTYTTPQQDSVALATVDLNGDGNLDLVVVGTDHDTANWSYSVLLGNGDGTFQPAVYYPQNLMPAGHFLTIIVADFNNDHKPDLAIGIYGNQSLAVLLGNGDGTFAPPAYLFDSGGLYLASADFNGDGNADLAATGQAGLAILLGNGDGTFQPAAIVFEREFGRVFAGDLNGDGKADLITGLSNGGSETFLGHGDGTFAALMQSQVYSFVALADLNGDGIPDLVGIAPTKCCGVYLGNGDGTFGSYVSVTSFGNPGPVNSGSLLSTDMNGDGKPDLIIGASSSAAFGVFVLINTTPPPPVDFAIGPAAGTQTSQTVSAGQGATFNLLVTPSASFSGTVNLGCTISPAANPAPTCNLPASVNVTSGTSTPFAVKVATVAPMAAGAVSQGRFPSGPMWMLWTGLFGAGLLLMRKRTRLPAAALAMVLGMVGLVGCGGGSSSPSSSGGTPAGTYTMIVTASSGSLKHTQTLTVIVQ